MEDYEIRILNARGQLTLEAMDRHTSDFSAIRAALRLRKQGESAQVWRGDECVYSDPSNADAGLVWPLRSRPSSP